MLCYVFCLEIQQLFMFSIVVVKMIGWNDTSTCFLLWIAQELMVIPGNFSHDKFRLEGMTAGPASCNLLLKRPLMHFFSTSGLAALHRLWPCLQGDPRADFPSQAGVLYFGRVFCVLFPWINVFLAAEILVFCTASMFQLHISFCFPAFPCAQALSLCSK